jgi:hypothetical protein
MKKIIIVSIISVFIIILSCDDQVLLIKCADCTTDEPTEATLVVKIDPIVENGADVFVDIFEGNIEDGILLGRFGVSSLKWEHKVLLNKKYTLAATYDTGGVFYVAIDTATPKVHYETEQCENPCYLVYDHIVNLRVKYSK